MLTHKVQRSHLLLSTSLGLGLGLIAVLLALPMMGLRSIMLISTVQAATSVHYVAPTGTDDNNDCTNQNLPCATPQHAVDIAAPGDEIRVAAGTYTGVSPRNGITQVVYIDKPVSVRGGFSPANWTSANPLANPTTLDAQGQGRVMVITGSITATIEGLRVTGGRPDSRNCGGICVVAASVLLQGNTIFSNTSGGIFVVFGRATLINNTIHNNSAETGGGVYITSGQATLKNNTILHNQADLSGGGVAADYASSLQLETNFISDNTAGESGGGVYVYYQSQADLDGDLISGNEADRGGGIYVMTATTRISRSRIISNFAAVGGGGAWLQHSEATLSRNTVTTNTGLLIGGGVTLEASKASLANNIFGANSSGVGGGLYLTDHTEATLTNSIIADNQAPYYGGSGLYINDHSTTRLLHTTLARNRGGDGSGVHVTFDSTAALTNTILVSQTVGISTSAESNVTLNGVLWYGNDSNTGGPGTITVTNEYTGQARFAAPDQSNYHLRFDSAALDKGVDAGVTEDIDGEPRPYDGGFDLGADEGQPNLTVSKVATPPLAQPGAPLTYTIRVTNSDFITLTTTITDVLPEQVTPSGVRVWSPTIAPGNVWTEQVVVMADPEYEGPLTNVVQVSSQQGAAGEDVHMVPAGRLYYLPVIFREE